MAIRQGGIICPAGNISAMNVLIITTEGNLIYKSLYSEMTSFSSTYPVVISSSKQENG